MIPLPTTGFQRSIKAPNVELDALADWMEASALLEQDGVVHGAELVDILVEGEIYAKQDFCWEMFNNALRELRRRSRLGPACPFRIVRRRVERVGANWREVPAHLFLLLLTLSHRYDKWNDVMPINYNLQGDLFERLTKESFEYQFPDWLVRRTGWKRAQPTKLAEVVEEIAGLLGELQGEVIDWAEPEAHEAGLDLLCYRPFSDSRVGIPVLMLQCASGSWREPGKLKTPDLEVWTKVVQFASKPKKAFATPFCFQESQFRKITNLVNGILLDRYRLLVFKKPESEWLSGGLREELLGWVEERLAKLQELAN